MNVNQVMERIRDILAQHPESGIGELVAMENTLSLTVQGEGFMLIGQSEEPPAKE